MKIDINALRGLIREAIVQEDLAKKPTGKAQAVLKHLGKDPVVKATAMIRTRTDAESVIMDFVKENLGSVAPADVIKALSNVTTQLKKLAATVGGDEGTDDE